MPTPARSKSTVTPTPTPPGAGAKPPTSSRAASSKSDAARTASAAIPTSGRLYSMGVKYRLLHWLPRLLVGFCALGSILAMTRLHHWYLDIPFIVLILFCGRAFYASRKQNASLVVWTDLQGNDLNFHLWNGKDVVVPRRGRTLRKAPSRTNTILTFVQVVDRPEVLTFSAPDKQAQDLLADLEKRGVLRGAGTPKPKLPPHLAAG